MEASEDSEESFGPRVCPSAGSFLISVELRDVKREYILNHCELMV